jgi:DNA-directed RNA polymerase specialized sigma24 family protein
MRQEHRSEERWKAKSSWPELVLKISGMDDQQRTVVALHHVEGLNRMDVADVLEMSEVRVISIFVDALEPIAGAIAARGSRTALNRWTRLLPGPAISSASSHHDFQI